MPYCSIKEAWGNMNNDSNSTVNVNKHLFTNTKNNVINNNINQKQHQKLDMNYLIPDKYRNVSNLYNNNNNNLTRVNYKNIVEKPYSDKPSRQIYNYSKNTNNNKNNNKNNSNDNNSMIISNLNSQNRKNLEYIQYLEKRIEQLENKLMNKENELNNNNNKDSVYDIFIYVFSGIFILFILDLVLRLGKYLGQRQLNNFPSAPSFSPKMVTNPLQLGGFNNRF